MLHRKSQQPGSLRKRQVSDASGGAPEREGVEPGKQREEQRVGGHFGRRFPTWCG